MGTRFICALSALAFIGLLTMPTDGALAQQASSDSPAKVCREKIAQTYGYIKHIGPVDALQGATLRRRPSMYSGPDMVSESNVRLFRARVQSSNIFAMSLDKYEICFFEKRGTSYRFVQICSTKGLTSTFDRCNMDWIVGDVWYDRIQKERKDMEKERRGSR